jgi:catechol 2,3-dioxygenase-like lactoylglutathione lyase family enzyme
MSRCLILLFVVGAAMVNAQAPSVSAPGNGLIVGAGNFFSPIVSKLEQGIAFYRDGLGLEVTGQPSNADDNPALRDMFGLPGAKLRWTIARPTGTRNGIEIIEITQAGGRALNRRIQDPGAVTLSRWVDELDPVLMRLKALGAAVVSKGEAPVTTGDGGPIQGTIQQVVVRAPDGHFVHLSTRGPRTTAADDARLRLDGRVRLTVSNYDRAIALYQDALGLRLSTAGYGGGRASLFGIDDDRSKLRFITLDVPGSAVVLELMELTGIDRRTVSGSIQDPGSTRMQLQVRDLDAAIQAVVRAGGSVISTGGKPVELPAGRGAAIRAAIVRDPDNLFLVLIEARPRP